MASLKVYAPLLGLRTALITFVQFLASAAAFWSFVLIAVLAAFAMVGLFNFFMNGVLLQVRVVFLQLDPFRGVFLILGTDVTAGTRNTGRFLLRALQNYLYPASFLCHC